MRVSNKSSQFQLADNDGGKLAANVLLKWKSVQVVPQTQELQFTYIPGGSEIISIDAYNRSTSANDFVIGITIIKVEGTVGSGSS